VIESKIEDRSSAIGVTRVPRCLEPTLDRLENCIVQNDERHDFIGNMMIAESVLAK